MYKDRYVFPAIFHVAEDGISISFPDLPGCLPCAEDMENALKNAREALSLHLYGMEEDGEEIPEPTLFTELEAGDKEVIVLIDTFMPPFRDIMAQKSVTTTITLPRWLKELANKENVNMSQVLQNELKKRFGVYDYLQIIKKDKGKL